MERACSPSSGWLYVCRVHGSQSIPDNYRSFLVYFMSGLSLVWFLKVFLAILASIFIEDELLYRKRIHHKGTAQQIFPKWTHRVSSPRIKTQNVPSVQRFPSAPSECQLPTPLPFALVFPPHTAELYCSQEDGCQVAPKMAARRPGQSWDSGWWMSGGCHIRPSGVIRGIPGGLESIQALTRTEKFKKV